MVIKNKENLSLLLENFIKSQKNLEIAFIYSRQGILISKYGRLNLRSNNEAKIEESYGAISELVETIIKKINMEYKIGHFGSGTFEAPKYQIIFLEAGPEAILLCTFDRSIDLSQLFPLAYLIAEKIAALLEDSFDFKFNSLNIPDITFHEDYSLELEEKPIESLKPFFDRVYLKYHIKQEKKQKKIFKLILLGGAAVGKTTLISSFLEKKQTRDYRPTLALSISSQKFYVQGFKEDIISFLIYDIAGQAFFRHLRHEYYRGANCVFIVYDITRKETLDDAINFWYEDAREKLEDIPFVLIGNKIDLEEKREISKKEGLEMAERIGSFFIETSALKNINVQDIFKIIGIRLYLDNILKTSEFKTDLIATTSHELRTPLNAIIGFTDLLIEQEYGKLNNVQLDFLNDIKVSSEYLLQMISHIMDLSKIEAGRLKLNLQKFSLNNIIEQVNSTLIPLFSKKGLKFKVEGLNKLKEIHADPDRFKEIIYNLLSNAIKFTEKGIITLRAIEELEHWEFQVIDTGIGIAKKDYNVVFREFGRIEHDKNKNVTGTGLGLALTKKLINLHKGKIWFESEVGKGTTFFFTIPKK